MSLPLLPAMWLVGQRRRVGWALSFVIELEWLYYGLMVAPSGGGFVVLAVVLAVVYAKNWWGWR